MKVKRNTKSELALYLKRLPAEQIKQAVIQYLKHENSATMNWENYLLKEIAAFQEWVKNQRKSG